MDPGGREDGTILNSRLPAWSAVFGRVDEAWNEIDRVDEPGLRALIRPWSK
jgi:hypothetical protein